MKNEQELTEAEKKEINDDMDQAFDVGQEAFETMTDFLSEKSNHMGSSAYHVWVCLTEVLVNNDGWTAEQLTKTVIETASANNADGKHLLN